MSEFTPVDYGRHELFYGTIIQGICKLLMKASDICWKKRNVFCIDFIRMQ